MRKLKIWQKLLLLALFLITLTVGLLLAFSHFIAIPTFNDVENRPANPALIR